MPVAAEVVKPLDWQRAVIRDPEIESTPVVAIVACLVTLAPGRPHRTRAASDLHGWDFYASAVTLAHLSHLSERAVRDALAALRTRGYLCQVKRGGNRNRGRAYASEWRLTLPSEPADGAVSFGDSARSEPADGAVSPPVDNSPGPGVNRHEHASEPAPGAAQERVYTKSSMAVGLLRTEGPFDKFATDADAVNEDNKPARPRTAGTPGRDETPTDPQALGDAFKVWQHQHTPNGDAA